MIIPEGYKLAVLTPDGTVIDQVDIGGSDLSNPFAQHSVCDEIAGIVARELPDTH